MDAKTHLYLHNTQGAKYVSGLGLINFTIGDGSLETHRKFAVNSGITYDEDLSNSFTGIETPGVYSQIPIIYRIGSSDWRIKTKNALPYIESGSPDWTDASGRPAFNGQAVAGIYDLQPVTNNNYFCVHYFCLPEVNEKIIGILGQTQYTTLNLARTGAQTELYSLITTGLPVAEMLAIATVIFKSGNSNAVSITQP